MQQSSVYSWCKMQQRDFQPTLDVGNTSLRSYFLLHQLPICFRIHFKILLIAFKSLHGLSLHFSSFNPLFCTETPQIREPKAAESPGLKQRGLFLNVFTVLAPTLWNKDPSQYFKKLLKTHLFTLAFV